MTAGDEQERKEKEKKILDYISQTILITGD